MPKKDIATKMDETRLEAEIANLQQDNKSRSRIAYWFTIAFISIIGGILIFAPVYNAVIGYAEPINVLDLVTGFMAQFGTPLGFVLGYYFKDKK